jgi:hypothetical protein
MDKFISTFGWVALIFFVAVALTVIVYSVVVFLSLPMRVLGTKIKDEVKILKEDITEKGELKRIRLAKKRIAQDKIKNQKLDAKFGEGTSTVPVELPVREEKPKKAKGQETDAEAEEESA